MNIEFNTDVAQLTTFGIHARAACVAHYADAGELLSLLDNTALPHPRKAIGEGSNLLFTADFPGTLLICDNVDASFVMHTGGRVDVEAAAGMSMDSLVDECCHRGLWGLENLSGIPGSVGASAVQNVGAYGVEAADVISTVTALDTATHDIVTFVASELDYGYRTSMFKQPDNSGRYIILSVTYTLTTRPTPRLGYAHLRTLLPDDLSKVTPADVRDAVISMRDSKLPSPAFVGSAGSFFKNPIVDAAVYERIANENRDVDVPHYIESDGHVKIPAAWLIDHCGLKGAKIGGAAVWHKQPLVIVNAEGNATPTDVIALEHEIINAVDSRYGIMLSPEVEHLP